MSKFKKLKEKLKKNNRLTLILLPLFLSFQIYAQQKIRFKKEGTIFVLYKSGAFSDSLISENFKNNLFTYIVPDSLKKRYVINSCNGLFISSNNDSLIYLKHSKGLQYQLVFEKEIDNAYSTSKKSPKLKSQINGVCDAPPSQIKIELLDLKNEKVLLTNYYYLDIK